MSAKPKKSMIASLGKSNRFEDYIEDEENLYNGFASMHDYEEAKQYQGSDHK